MLHVITNQALVSGDFAAVVAKVAEAGPDVIQLREKQLVPRQLYELACQVRHITTRCGVRLIINGSVEVALAVDADGVHLGQGSLPLSVARRLLPGKLVGVSVHAVDEAVAAQQGGADYVIVGHIFATPSKAGLPPRGLSFLTAVCQAVSIPVIAIGGITPDNAPLVREAGAAGAAVMSAVMAAAEPHGVVRQLKEALR